MTTFNEIGAIERQKAQVLDPIAPFGGDTAQNEINSGLGIKHIYALEMHRANRSSLFGVVDMYLGAKGMVGGVILEALQTDYEQMQLRGEELDTNNIVLQAATLPVDWKGVALAGAVYAATSGLRRAKRPLTVGADIEKTLEATQAAEEFIPHTEDTYKRFRKARRAKEVVGTTLVTGVAYKVGEKLSMDANIVLGSTFGIASAANYWASRMKFNRRGY